MLGDSEMSVDGSSLLSLVPIFDGPDRHYRFTLSDTFYDVLIMTTDTMITEVFQILVVHRCLTNDNIELIMS